MAITKKQLVSELMKEFKDFNSSASDSSYSLKKRCDQLAGFLYITMQTLEDNNIDSYVLLKHDNLRKWWVDHKESVRQAEVAAEAKRIKAELRAQALARLTDAEKEALGLKKK